MKIKLVLGIAIPLYLPNLKQSPAVTKWLFKSFIALSDFDIIQHQLAKLHELNIDH